MYQKVKHQLVTIYTVSSGIILIIALISLYLANVSQIRNQYQKQYDTLVADITDSIKQNNVIRSDQLIEIEKEYHAIIYVEENGVDVGYQGSYMPNDRKITLLKELRKKITDSGMDLSSQNILGNDESSECCSIHINSKEHFWGSAVKIGKENSYLVILMLMSLKPMYHSYQRTAIRYIIIFTAVMFFMYFLSRVLMRKVLNPLKVNKQKQDDFIACASHELRSPLAYIKTANSTLHSSCLPYIDSEHKESLQSFIDNTSQECDRMSLLIEEMLELASANQTTWTIQNETMDLDVFFLETCEKLLPYCTSKHHYFEMILPEETFGTVPVDEKRLYQVILTLVNNALQYTSEGTKITLTAEHVKKSLLIQVIDHGNGIPDAEKAKIFDRYFQQDSSHSDRNHFGLGLSIAKELIELLGGTIVITDTKGGGCTFQIKLPICN